jgi:hypothetical protein
LLAQPLLPACDCAARNAKIAAMLTRIKAPSPRRGIIEP